MGNLRPCPWCGGAHRKKTTAKKCYERHHGKKKWTAKELGRS